MRIYKENYMEKAFKALGDISRLELFLIIHGVSSICLCNLEICFKLSISNLSRHLKELDSAGLITWQKKGKWKYYSVTEYGSLFIDFIHSTADKVIIAKLKENLKLLQETKKCYV